MKNKILGKLLSTVLTVSLVTGIVCTANYGDSKAYAATKWTQVKGEKLSDAILEATENHEKLQTKENAFEGFKERLNYNTAQTANISESEINSLLSNSNGKKSLTYDEAVSDVNLYFKALKYGYGAYEYFGGDTRFNKAKQEVLSKLKGKKTVLSSNLAKYLQSAMSFVIDGHFSVDGLSNTEKDSVSYQYYYDYSHTFSKDSKGYYKTVNGKKWYYKSCSTKSVTIQKSLTTAGEIVYSPVLFCKKSKSVAKSTITLVNGQKTKKETVNWKEQKSFNSVTSCREPDFNYLKKNGIAYISVRNFDGNYENELSKFVESGASAKDASMIIFDIRSNGGGSDEFATQWVEKFTGEKPVLNSVFNNKLTALSGWSYSKETYDINSSLGYMINNNIPIIVLVDDKCGSAGESMLLDLRALDNVIVIGGNSSGAQLCGNVQGYRLPNSGITVDFGRSLQFVYKMANVDDRGYAPDIWCDPSSALKAVTNMLKKQNYISSETASYFKNKIGDSYKQLAIEFIGSLVPAGESFGKISNNKLNVLLNNGKKITNYTVKSTDPSKLTAKKLSNGKLHLKVNSGAVTDGERVKFVITYGGKDYSFVAVC